MASYTTSLRLVQPATGEYSGTWGAQVNAGLTALVDTSIAGSASIIMTAANYTLTNNNGATDEARAMFLVLGGAPGASYQVIVPAVSKLYFVTNGTGFAQTVKTLSGSGILVPNGARVALRCTGPDVVEALNYFGSLTLGAALPIASGGTGAATFASNNVLLGNGTSTFQAVAPGTSGNVLTSNGTTWQSTAPVSVASITFGSTGLTPNTATTGAVSVAGTLVAVNGGTGQSSYAVGDLLYASTTTALSKLADIATGNALISGGVGVAPSYGKIGLTTHISGTLAVGNGGTGATTLTANNVILGNGASAVNFVAPGTAGNVLTSNGTTWQSTAASSSLLGVTQSASPFETSLGYQAGDVSTGVYNTFIGYQSGLVNSTSGYNTFIGSQSGLANTAGFNTAVGAFSLKTNTVGINNTAIGYSALALNLNGQSNTAVGNQALTSNQSGSGNVAVGLDALDANTIGDKNIGVGQSALGGNLSGNYNIAIGDIALFTNQSGSNNVAIGSSALQTSTASNNTAVGFSALKGNTTATANTAVGYNALTDNSTGSSNTALGFVALDSNTTGSANTAVGSEAGLFITTSSNNTLIGYNSGRLTTGDSNTALGGSAGSSLTTGSNNTVLGNSAQAGQTGNNNTVIGYTASSSSNSVSNEITLGNSSVTALRIPGLTITAGAKYINLGVSTVAALPLVATAGSGARAFVSDANATTFATIVAGGGANPVPVYCDGTNWRIG